MKDTFLQIYRENIQRPGAEHLLRWISDSDFFTAPASTQFHLNCEGGLVTHSVNVFRRLASMNMMEQVKYSTETIAICALLHDLCKVNFYGTEYRNKKDSNGQWRQVAAYVVKDQYPFGHGEKSFYLISRCMQLTPEEAIAIRWHMGGFDDSARGGSYAISDAFQKYPLAVMLHAADLMASYMSDNAAD